MQRAPQSSPTAPAPGVAHAVFNTFDGLKIDVAGRKDGTRTLVSFTTTATQPAAEAAAKTLTDRLNGWEFEIPSYKYDGMFRPLEDLLKKLPEPAAKGAKGAKDSKPAKQAAADAAPQEEMSPGPGK